MPEKSKLAILIVDDRPDNLSSMEQLLAQEGLEILTAQSGNEALAMMLETDLALVLLDVQMPGMDGFEVAELMRRTEQTRNIPIIFVTAIHKERRHINSGFEAGAVDYMFKPVDPFILRSKVRVFLDIKRYQLSREKLLNDLNEANQRLQEISDRKSDFLSAAAHELRTPLTVIKEHCSLVHDGLVGDPNDEQKSCMDSALRNCNRLARLVNDLLDLDSIESGHGRLGRASVELDLLIQEAFADFQPHCLAAGQTLELDVEDDLPACLADDQMVAQVFVNLLGNAVKFTPSGGRITIRAKVVSEGVRVEVADTGRGIEPADQVKVFEKFTQLTRRDGPGPQGTGLGLAITHKIIELLDGELGLESTPGQGSVFHFTLPLFSTGRHMKALVADGAYRGFSSRTEWSLVLLRPAQAGHPLPLDFLDTLASVVRRTDDLVVETVVDDGPAMAVLLQAAQDGAFGFLSRLEETLGKVENGSCDLQFAVVKVPREARGNFDWVREKVMFEDLISIQDVKGMQYV